ncbi:hypothetical protein D3C78_1903120 [compost metagenome]
MHRVGLEHIKKIVLDDEARRKELHQRLLFALSFEQDPWQQQVETPALKKEFERIPVKLVEPA